MPPHRPPSTSPSPSPGPDNGKNINSRASMGPSARLAPASPRPGGVLGAGRPTSELLGSAGMFQTPEAEAIDQWFENLQNYEATLEEMAAASLDVNFKEELSAIEQWFKVLSEAERTAALYSLLQHSTQVQIRFFITVLQQMARSDPMTALLSPAMGGSMQNQMEAKLAQLSLKSPGLKSNMPSSPSARNFSAPSNANRQSLALESTSNNNFLSPDTAAMASPGTDAAATLAQQRAKLKASNAAHRISAPVLASGNSDNRATWGSQLGQVAEQNGSSSGQELVVPSNNSARPKSTEFSGTLGSPRPGGAESTLSPMAGDSWASMVNTPLIPMFKDARNPPQNLDAAASKLNDWSGGSRVPLMDDPKKFRRVSKNTSDNGGNPGQNGSVYDNDGNLVVPGSGTGGQQQQQQQQRRNANVGNTFGGQGGWSGAAGARSPALSNTSNRFGNDDGGNLGGINGLGMNGFNMGMGSPGLGMGMPGMNGLAGINPLQMNMLAQMNAMGISGMSPEAQLLAAQMAASGFAPNQWLGGVNQMQGSNNGRRGPGSSRSLPSGKTVSSSGRSDRKDDEEVDPQLLNDVPAWLRSLRLHKYTPNFEGMNWKDMVLMDEAALEAKGVAALGARRKMLKTFEIVRAKMGIDSPGTVTSA